MYRIGVHGCNKTVAHHRDIENFGKFSHDRYRLPDCSPELGVWKSSLKHRRFAVDRVLTAEQNRNHCRLPQPSTLGSSLHINQIEFNSPELLGEKPLQFAIKVNHE
jgi:hypothetical protein